MCGTLLERRPAEVATGQVSVADRLRALTEDEPPKPPRNNSGSAEPRRAAVPSFLGLDDEAPRRTTTSSSGISGPSFLGLDAPAERSNYLLDEEEPQSHWRGYLVALVVVAIAILIALQWRAEVKSQAQKVGAILWARMHAAPAQPNVNEKVASGAPPETTAPAQTAPAQPQGASETSTPTNSAPATSAAAQPSISPGPTPAANESANAATAQPSPPPANKPAANVPEKQTPPSPAKASETASAANARKPAGTDQQADALLLTAQKYLHGLGVPRDCEQGLVYLKQAVREASAPARSQMGALYATGTCVPQNRVEAYKWFSSAMEVEPNNPWLGRERDSLYGEMSAAERQQLNR
jgi:outer membrane biosynthesis protein TonB